MIRNKGFTAIELVVAVTIVLLLVAVAVASFQDHMQRKTRVQASKALIETANWLQQQHAQSGTYLVKLPQTSVPQDGEPSYKISLIAAPYPAADPKTVFPATTDAVYTLQAVPLADDPCGILLLGSNGQMGVSRAGAEVAECWR